MLHRAASALSVGGRLVLVQHGAAPAWSEHQHDVVFATPDEVLASLDLPPDSFRPLTVESRSRDAVGPHHEHATLLDTVVVVDRVA